MGHASAWCEPTPWPILGAGFPPGGCWLGEFRIQTYSSRNRPFAQLSVRGDGKSAGNSHESRSRSLCSGMESVNRHLDPLLCHCATVPACTPWVGWGRWDGMGSLSWRKRTSAGGAVAGWSSYLAIAQVAGRSGSEHPGWAEHGELTQVANYATLWLPGRKEGGRREGQAQLMTYYQAEYHQHLFEFGLPG
jgi:hypothetical protein